MGKLKFLHIDLCEALDLLSQGGLLRMQNFPEGFQGRALNGFEPVVC